MRRRRRPRWGTPLGCARTSEGVCWYPMCLDPLPLSKCPWPPIVFHHSCRLFWCGLLVGVGLFGARPGWVMVRPLPTGTFQCVSRVCEDLPLSAMSRRGDVADLPCLTRACWRSGVRYGRCPSKVVPSGRPNRVPGTTLISTRVAAVTLWRRSGSSPASLATRLILLHRVGSCHATAVSTTMQVRFLFRRVGTSKAFRSDGPPSLFGGSSSFSGEGSSVGPFVPPLGFRFVQCREPDVVDDVEHHLAGCNRVVGAEPPLGSAAVVARLAHP